MPSQEVIKPELLLLVGLPYSGKTEWARRQNTPIVCPDAVRKNLYGGRFVAEQEGGVWWITRIMVRSLFDSGHTRVILDASNVTGKRRAHWRNDDWRTKYVVFPIEAETCIERALILRDEHAVSLIRRLSDEWEDLSQQEAWDAVEPDTDFMKEVE